METKGGYNIGVDLATGKDFTARVPINNIEQFEVVDGSETPSTSCKTCILRTFENGVDGCKLGRIERFRKTANVIWVTHKYIKGMDLLKYQRDFRELSLHEFNQYALCCFHNNEIVEMGDFVDKPNLLNESSYYIIDGRFCNGYRDKYSEWSKNHQEENYVQDIRTEITTRLSFIVYLHDLSGITLLAQTLQSIINQTIKPKEVIILNNFQDLNPKIVTDALDILDKYNIFWRHIRNLRDDVNRGYCFDMAIDRIQGNYYTFVDAGYIFKPDFTEQIDISLNDRLDIWLCLSSPDCLVAQSKITKLLSGFQEIKPANHNSYIYGIDNKIRYFMDVAKKKDMVLKLEDIVL